MISFTGTKTDRKDWLLKKHFIVFFVLVFAGFDTEIWLIFGLLYFPTPVGSVVGSTHIPSGNLT